MAWTVEQKSTNLADTQSAEEARIKLIIFNQTLRCSQNASYVLCTMYYLHKNFTNMLQKLAKTCATFSYFFLFYFLRNKLWTCDGKSNVFPPSREREREDAWRSRVFGCWNCIFAEFDWNEHYLVFASAFY